MNIRLIIFSGIVSAVTMFASDEISHGIGGNPSVCEERAPESNESKIWSFDDCIDWALENNTDLRRNLLSQLQADQNTAEAKDAWLPTVGFSTVQGFVNYPKPQEGISANGYNSSYGINANWTVWEGNVRKYRLESSRLLRAQQILAGEDLVRNLRLSILQSYLNILYARESVTIAKKTLEVSDSQLQRARRLEESGRTSKVEVSQIESQNATDRYGLVQAEGNLATAVTALKNVLALGLDYDLNIADITLDGKDVNLPLPSKEETFRNAVAWLPGIKSNDLSKEIYDNDIKIAKAGRMPTISLSGGVGTGYNSGGRNWTYQMGRGFNENASLLLSVPIYDGNATKRAVAKARIASLEYEIDRQELLDDLSQTIDNLYVESENSRSRYESGLKQLEAAEMTAELVDRQFDLGLVNPLELLTAHNDLLNARLAVLQSKFMAILSDKTIMYYATANVSL